MCTISALARRFGLSRAAPLRYDRLGLLRPSGRTEAGYRLYTERDAERLERVHLYRQADVPLETIGRLLENDEGLEVRSALSDHLAELGRRARVLRERRERVLTLLNAPDGPPRAAGTLSAAEMTTTLRAAGLDDAGLDRLHEVFERTDPEAHAAFLEAPGLTAEDAERVRKRARGGKR